MVEAARDIALPAELLRHLRRGVDAVPSGASQRPWQLSMLGGRLVEVVASASSAALTVALGLLREAQEQGETAAWVTTDEALFFPPDAAAGGIDLERLPVVSAPRRQVPRAVDRLARSGAFGLVVVDLLPGPLHAARAPEPWPQPLSTRLLGAAHRHGVAVVFLVGQGGTTGSLVSLRVEATRKRLGPSEFQVEVRSIKDKRRAPGWSAVETCHGPAGLR
ncbi:MAG: DNA recombination/repair protein RecA [Myxococcota bacterium]|jgi:recombination protein RecA|nr:DNA recombination/repair protein RecA [Myxococcota bacterium]